MDSMDLGIIRFDPTPNAGDMQQFTASVNELECYVSVDLGIDGLWIISIDGDFVADEYPTPQLACMASLGHLVVYAVDVVVQAPGIDDADLQRRAKLCRDWLCKLTDRLRTQPRLPDSIHHALNSGSATYKP